MSRFLRGGLWIFLGLYAMALIVFLLGTYGIAGVARDPLSGVYLILLGQPWVRWIDHLPEGAWPAAAALAPAVNLLLLRLLERVAAARSGG